MNSGYKLIYHKSALKFIAKLDKPTQTRISNALRGLTISPPEGDIRRLKGYVNLYRLRIGTYRVIFEANHQEETVYIEAIGNRGDIYKKFTLYEPEEVYL